VKFVTWEITVEDKRRWELKLMVQKFRDIRVLVIEGSEATFAIVRNVLATFSITKVFPVFDIEEGFDAYRQHSPDLILIGIMDNFDAGIALTKQTRLGKDSPDPVIPIIFMMGTPTRGQVFGARDAGVSEFLIKPYSAHGLFQKIEGVIEHPGTFVKSEDFFGPDRRGKKDAAAPFAGENRRTKAPLIVDAKEARELLKTHFQSKHGIEDKGKDGG
jgi:DNA-binding response OmpR family regulator